MLVLMFDPRLHSMQLLITFLNHENVATIVVKCNQELLLPLLIKATKLLMHVGVKEVEDLQFQGNAKVLFQTTSPNANTFRDLMSRKLVELCLYVVDVENYKCALSWWHKEQIKFLTFVILVQHIIGIQPIK